MSKRTLLELTQGILSAIDGDEINSISDTIEAGQVVNIIKETYYDLVDESSVGANFDLINLEGLADSDTPTHMRIPEDVSNILWIKYDTRAAVSDPKHYVDIAWKDPKEFVEICNSRDSTDTDNYQVVAYNANTSLIIGIAEQPHYWTSFDDEYIVFDSLDLDVDTTLQSSKTQAYGQLRNVFSTTDTYIPDIPENLFSYLAATAEARAFSQLRQQINSKSEQRESRMRTRLQRNRRRHNQHTERRANYGRK